MNKTLKGFALGVLTSALVTSGVALAKTSIEFIEVSFADLKVYVDNSLAQLRDANGNEVEPFIYNGTTYLPVRGVAELAGMKVEWDDKTKSVHLWKNEKPETVSDGVYLTDVCPPYDGGFCTTYLESKKEIFKMAGVEYTNGFSLGVKGGYDGTAFSVMNLNGKYETMEFTVGHVDGTSLTDATVVIFVDGQEVRTLNLSASFMPQRISIPLSKGSQLRIDRKGERKNVFGNWVLADGMIGFGNVVLK